uniref:Protein Spindly n=1 Tax=Glossina austeni TaxID=7395 RepID=A0A1A9V067_GLOAU
MDDYSDVLNLSHEDLLEKYCKLYDRYQEMVKVNEADTQRIYELKGALHRATAAESFLSQELEQVTSYENDRNTNDLRQLQQEIERLENANRKLKQDFDVVVDENIQLSKAAEETAKNKTDPPVVVTSPQGSKLSDEDFERMQMLENENFELLRKMEESQQSFVRYTLTIAEYEKNIEILRDQVNCLEENLKSKQADLEEKVSMLESTQEQLIEANASLAMMTSMPGSDDRKGNSLFAEVDDQRQAMKKLLNAQKKSYLEMKKIYSESEYEIRRLKRENTSMRTEFEACSSIFCHADRTYQEKLKQRIQRLLSENEGLESKLNWTQEQLKELSSERGVLWLDSMLNFCKKETDTLKQQLHSERLQKASLEEQLRNALQDMARWRFESLKSRCVLLNREYLLNEHTISFEPVQAMDFHITNKQQEEARPRIINRAKNDLLNSTVMAEMKKEDLMGKDQCSKIEKIGKKLEEKSERNELTKSSYSGIKNDQPPSGSSNVGLSDCEKSEISPKISKEIAKVNLIQEATNNLFPKSEASASDQQESEKKSQTNESAKKEDHDDEQKPKNESRCNESLTKADYEFKGEQKLQGSPVRSFNIYKDNENYESSPKIKGKFFKLVGKPPSPMRPSQRVLKKPDKVDKRVKKSRSILTEKRDLFCDETPKNVTFSKETTTIPSPTFDKSSSEDCANVSNETLTSLSTNSKISKISIKGSRTKSNIVVRRVIVSSKRD